MKVIGISTIITVISNLECYAIINTSYYFLIVPLLSKICKN